MLKPTDLTYKALPHIDCKQLCGDTACGPIQMSRDEAQRIDAFLGWRVNPRSKREGTCPMLKNGRCRVYPVRPMICRVWGLVPSLRCPFGCEPDHWLTDEEAMLLLSQTINPLDTANNVFWGVSAGTFEALVWARRQGIDLIKVADALYGNGRTP